MQNPKNGIQICSTGNLARHLLIKIKHKIRIRGAIAGFSRQKLTITHWVNYLFSVVPLKL